MLHKYCLLLLLSAVLLVTAAPRAAAVYDSDQGRWLSRDPIGEDGGLNLYGYVDNDPVGSLDPFGLDTVGFYDRKELGDPKNPFIAKAKHLKKNSESKCDRSYGVGSLADAVKVAKALKKQGVKIDSVRLDDHAYPGGQEFGDTTISPGDPKLPELGNVIEKGGGIDLGGCQVGKGPEGKKYLDALSKKAGVPVRGSSHYQLSTPFGPTSSRPQPAQ